MNSRHSEKSVCSGAVIEELKVARVLGHAWLCCPDASLEKLSLLLKATVENRLIVKCWLVEHYLVRNKIILASTDLEDHLSHIYCSRAQLPSLFLISKE